LLVAPEIVTMFRNFSRLFYCFFW